VIYITDPDATLRYENLPTQKSLKSGGTDMSLRHHLMAAVRRCHRSILRTLLVAGVAASTIATARAETFANGLTAFNIGDYAAAY
jgi:hypothetical protein